MRPIPSTKKVVRPGFSILNMAGENGPLAVIACQSLPWLSAVVALNLGKSMT
jgi:hypothetical protein